MTGTTAKRGLRAWVELDQQVDLDPTMWDEGPPLGSVQGMLPVIPPAGLFLLFVHLVCQCFALPLLAVAILVAYFHAVAIERFSKVTLICRKSYLASMSSGSRFTLTVLGVGPTRIGQLHIPDEIDERIVPNEMLMERLLFVGRGWRVSEVVKDMTNQ